jgi:pyruvate dehydrogenase E1 component beta subunit
MSMQIQTMIQAINTALSQEMARDQSVIVFGEDVGKEGGVFRATEGLQKEFGEERCFDTPLAESGIIGTSIGLAINGMRPVCEIQFSGFYFEGFAQLMCHAGRIRNRTRGMQSVPMVVRMPYGGGIKALEHHSESMEAITAHTQGLKVVIPSTPFDAKGLLIAAIRDPDPVVFMEPKRLYRAFKQEVPEEEYHIPIGKAATVRQGTDITLIAWGSMMRECQEAAALAQKEGISCEIVDVRTIYPLDEDTILASVAKTGRAVVVHEAPQSFGPGAEISALIHENLFESLKAPVKRVAGADIIMPLLRREDFYMPDEVRILEAVKTAIK